MRILADVNVPEEYVSALRGDGHTVAYSRNVDALGPTATDTDIIEYAERKGIAVLSTDVKDFSGRDAKISVFVAPQDMAGGDVRAAVARVEALPFDPAGTDPICSLRCRHRKIAPIAPLHLKRLDYAAIGIVRNH